MIIKQYKKLINIISFILILLSGFFLLGRLYTIFNNPETKFNHNFTYLIILIIVIVAFVQLIFNLIQREEKIITPEENSVENKNQTEEKVSTVNKGPETEVDIKNSSINSEEVLNRIIPSKLATIEEFGEKLLTNLSGEFEIVQGILYIKNLSENIFSSVSYYAYFSSEKPKDFKEGNTLPGQVAKNKEILFINNIPDNYIKVLSGLGEGNPNYLTIIPVVREEETIAIIEFASFKDYHNDYSELFKNLGTSVSDILNNYIKKTENTRDDKE